MTVFSVGDMVVVHAKGMPVWNARGGDVRYDKGQGIAELGRLDVARVCFVVDVYVDTYKQWLYIMGTGFANVGCVHSSRCSCIT